MTINQALDQLLSLESNEKKNELVKQLQDDKMSKGGRAEVSESTERQVQSLVKSLSEKK